MEMIIPKFKFNGNKLSIFLTKCFHVEKNRMLKIKYLHQKAMIQLKSTLK